MEKVRFIIVATEKDIPSNNIGNKLIETAEFKEYKDTPYKTYKNEEDLLIWYPQDLVFATDLDQHYDCEAYIFVFRHKGKNEEPLLTVHSCGNPTSKPMREGQPFEFGYTHPGYVLTLLKNLKKHCPEGFNVILEATHHSPTNLSKPAIFVEIGSKEEHWNNQEAINTVTQSILDFLRYQETDYKPCIGIGGGHYADRFTRRALEENLAFGHIIPAHAFSDTNKDTIKQAITKTIGTKFAVIDTRMQGKQEERTPIIEAIKENGIEIIKLK